MPICHRVIYKFLQELQFLKNFGVQLQIPTYMFKQSCQWVVFFPDGIICFKDLSYYNTHVSHDCSTFCQN